MRSGAYIRRLMNQDQRAVSLVRSLLGGYVVNWRGAVNSYEGNKEPSSSGSNALTSLCFQCFQFRCQRPGTTRGVRG